MNKKHLISLLLCLFVLASCSQQAHFITDEAYRAEVEKDFQATLAKSRRITLEDCRRRKWIWKLLGWLLRPLAPLM